MDPDIYMAECHDDERSHRVEADGYGPEQKEGIEVHSITREAEDAFIHERQIAVSLLEMVSSCSSCHSEISPHAVHGINAGDGEHGRDNGLKDRIEVKTPPIQPRQCHQSDETAAKQQEERCEVSSETNRFADRRRP